MKSTCSVTVRHGLVQALEARLNVVKMHDAMPRALAPGMKPYVRSLQRVGFRAVLFPALLF